MDKIFPALAGAVLGIIVWQTTPYSAEFGIGPLIFIIISVCYLIDGSLVVELFFALLFT